MATHRWVLYKVSVTMATKSATAYTFNIAYVSVGLMREASYTGHVVQEKIKSPPK